jgi:hypothetical protein
LAKKKHDKRSKSAMRPATTLRISEFNNDVLELLLVKANDELATVKTSEAVGILAIDRD